MNRTQRHKDTKSFRGKKQEARSKRILKHQTSLLPLASCILLLLTCSTAACVTAQTLPYQNPALSAHERAVDLCQRLTLEEKALLMQDESPAIERLGIKKFYWWSEALHGAANMGNVTVFPEPVAMAASFNPDLLYRVFDVASTEFRAQYHERMQRGSGEDEKFHSLSVWTPNVNIFRDPRWGRGQETYGEDPYLTSIMGDAVVRGLQGPESAKYRKLWACAKHYAVHSGPEYTRHTANLIDVPVRDLWETYLPAFKHLVQHSKVREVMCAYQRLDDEPCCGSTRLLQDILRREWGFQYLVVSDCGAVSDFYTSHKSSSSAVTASAKAVLAGTDVECGFGYSYGSIPEAVRRGLVSEQEIDKHVVRLLEGRFDLGEMDDASLVEWSRIPYSVMSSKAHAALALDMARQSLVLLQNKGGILPLSKRGEKIAVIGPNANSAPMMWGNYNGVPNRTVTILDGIRAKHRNVLYLPACDLTNDKVMDCLLASQCAADGRKGLKGTFWNNVDMAGKPVSTQQYTTPVAVTTAGMHNFAPRVNVEDFSARYETVFTPKEAGEYVVNVEGCGDFEVWIDGEQKVKMHTWRTTPTRTPIQAVKGKSYRIEVRFQFVKTWGANLKIDVAKELPIDYQQTIARLKGISKVVFVGGISPALEGEEMPVNIDGFKGGDRTSIELPRVQRDFLKALKAAGKQVILVNCSGSAIALEPETETCDAILQAWYAGQEGGTAVADVLFGDCNPSGKLPVTFYRNDAQLPDYEDYSMRGRTYRYFNDALFPFGYGLSYTTFRVGQATQELQQQTGTMTVSVPVANTGGREGTETLQLYLRYLDDAEAPLKTLRGFQRVTLKAGEERTVTLQLPAERFEFFDPQTNTMRIRPGRYQLLYGTSSRADDLQTLSFSL
ncbi:MAG: glycoside hydrolase family 3 C-terminal domain-containing protein [Prevotella sp.]|nr:glycoside hydrolase family 3 C-terminal domain-containing protein [Prevotella sp.]